MDMLKTVKEVSEQTGISVRTLHYYDEIGLLKPASYSESGYRLYDDKALETLQQILFFREFQIPLKEIKSIMECPDFDRNKVLRSQREMLRLKKERLERLMASIDDILKGENKMDFTVFSEQEIKSMCNEMIVNMDEEAKAVIVGMYGSLDNFREKFVEGAGREGTQKNFQKIVEWYGDKETAMEAGKRGLTGKAADGEEPGPSQILQAYQNRIDTIYKRLAEKMGTDVTKPEVKLLIGEYDFVAKQMFQMPDPAKMMLEMAHAYQNDEQMKAAMDAQYGEGASEYIGKAMEAFYQG